MSSWWPSGRYSPFGAHAPHGGPPRVTDDDYTYLSGDRPSEDRHGHGYGFPSHQASKPRPDDLSPDILVLKHKSTTYPLHFPAFSIAESELLVLDLRKKAAKETKTDDYRRVKLLYKGRQLRDDRATCKEEGLKQNSELMCVVSVQPREDADNDSSSSSASSALTNGAKGPRADVDGTIIDPEPRPSKRKGHRGGRKKKDKEPTRDSLPTSLQPPNGTTSSHSRAPSPAPTSTASTASSNISNATTSTQQPAANNSPDGRIQALNTINAHFNTTFLPRIKEFMAHPPSDSKTREYEWKKLSEGVLGQVIIKLDGVEPDGDPDVRARRRELVKSTQGWMSELDRAR